MRNIKNKRIIIPVIIIIFIGAAISVLPWWSDIDITLNGIQARIGDEEYTEEKEINIRGRYWRYLFRNDRFEGRVEVEGYDFTFDERMWLVQLSFQKYKYGGASVLGYMGYANGRFLDGAVWQIYSDPSFNKVLIINSDGNEGQLFISAPADNRAQAIDIANELENWRNWE